MARYPQRIRSLTFDCLGVVAPRRIPRWSCWTESLEDGWRCWRWPMDGNSGDQWTWRRRMVALWKRSRYLYYRFALLVEKSLGHYPNNLDQRASFSTDWMFEDVYRSIGKVSIQCSTVQSSWCGTYDKQAPNAIHIHFASHDIVKSPLRTGVSRRLRLAT